MDYNRSLVMSLRRDFDEVVKLKDGLFDYGCCTNVPGLVPTVEERLSEIGNRINELALAVGVPHSVPFDGELTLYPARKGGVKRMSDKAVSYTVDLRPFRNDFAAVRFEAGVPFGAEDIVRGVIVDEMGEVECECDNRYEYCCSWTRLPISPKSRFLVASIPLKDGEPEWLPRGVEFVSQGLAMDLAEISKKLYDDVSDISWRVKELEKLNGCKAA